MATVLIMGSTGGIGSAVARRLALDGHHLVLHYFSNKTLAESLQKECALTAASVHMCTADIRSPDDLKKLAVFIEQTHNSLDAVLNTCGLNSSATITDFSPSHFSNIIDTNLTGAATLVHSLLPLLQHSSQGRVVLFSSVVAYEGSPRRTAYTAAKAGLSGLTRALALELAERSITVNSIVPGYIDTPQFHTNNTVPLGERIDSVPLKRLGTPEEVAALARFIISPESGYITGQSFHINGGTYLS